MGLFRKKKEQTEEIRSKKSEEVILKESLETEVESLQNNFRTKQEEIEKITKKLHDVKEEYDLATSNLMSVKKESNQKKMELDTTYLEYNDIKLKLRDVNEKFNKSKKSIEELEKVESNLIKKKEELEKITKECNEINDKVIEDQSVLHEIHVQKIQVQKDLEAITSRLYNAKQEERSVQNDFNETEVFTSKEKEFIGSTDKREMKGVIEAASVVVGSLKSKLSMAEKEIETVQVLLEKERKEHTQTKNELEKLKEKLEQN